MSLPTHCTFVSEPMFSIFSQTPAIPSPGDSRFSVEIPVISISILVFLVPFRMNLIMESTSLTVNPHNQYFSQIPDSPSFLFYVLSLSFNFTLCSASKDTRIMWQFLIFFFFLLCLRLAKPIAFGWNDLSGYQCLKILLVSISFFFFFMEMFDFFLVGFISVVEPTILHTSWYIAAPTQSCLIFFFVGCENS